MASRGGDDHDHDHDVFFLFLALGSFLRLFVGSSSLQTLLAVAFSKLIFLLTKNGRYLVLICTSRAAERSRCVVREGIVCCSVFVGETV